MTIEEIKQWQSEFRRAPSVWIVTDQDGTLSNVYESREAAMLEIEKRPRYRLHEENIHSIDLARRRWGW